MDATELRSRRMLLTAGIGALAGIAASVVGRPIPVRASTDDPLVLGHTDNSADHGTGLNVGGGAGVGVGLQVDTGGLYAIKGQSGGAGSIAVSGFTPDGTGTSGGSMTGKGVHGVVFTSGHGVVGVAQAGTGAGLRGIAPSGRGAMVSGGLAQLRLVPSSRSTHPHSGQAGDLFLDKSKRLWFCKGGTSWTQVV
jgi:hypothetical protein